MPGNVIALAAAGAPKRRAQRIHEWATEHGISLRKAWDLAASGQIHVSRIGRCAVIYAEDSEDFDRRARAGQVV
jgi:hypothetical protein